MITDDEKFIEIQAILANSDISTTNCVKINDLIVELSKENQQLKDNWNKLKEYVEKTKIKEFEKAYGKRYGKTFSQAEIVICNMIKDKIEELESRCK